MYEKEKDKDELINLLIEALQNELDEMSIDEMSIESSIDSFWDIEFSTATDQLDFEIL